MINLFQDGLAALTAAGFAQNALGYAGVSAFARKARQALPSPRARLRPGVTVLKPLCGDEPLLEQALASFCRQDWPDLQILCGVADRDDTAIAVLERLRAQFPHIRLDLVQNPQLHGQNRKISNLINMLPFAEHEILIISDADMHVAPDFVADIVAELQQDPEALVTTLYRGVLPQPHWVGQLGAAYIAQVFAPGAMLARKLGRQDCFGATMALRRTTLQRVGGLEALVHHLADDAVLGQHIVRLGQAVRLARSLPATTIAETSLSALWRHELRWARTVRAIAPAGFAASILQYPLFFAVPWALSYGNWWLSALLFLGACLVRAILGRVCEMFLHAPRTPLYLAPLREGLSVAIWATAHLGRRVAWRGQSLIAAGQGEFSLAAATAKGPTQ